MTPLHDPAAVGTLARQKGGSKRPPKIVGYCRVSTDEQAIGLQADAMCRAGVDVCFEERASGASASRPVLKKLLGSLRAGDTLVIWRLDRLGRSLSHLLTIATELDAKGVHLRSLTDNFDTGTSAGRLLFAVLGAVAEFEREALRERTVAGMRAAQRRGQHVGRPRSLDGSRLAHIRGLLADGSTKGEISRLMRVSRSTLRRALALPAGGTGVPRS